MKPAKPVCPFLGQKLHSNARHHPFPCSCGTSLCCGGLYPPSLRYKLQSRPSRSPPEAPHGGPVTHHVALRSPEGTLCACSPVPHEAALRCCCTAALDGPSGDRDSSGDAPESSTAAPPHRVSHLPEDTSVSLV